MPAHAEITKSRSKKNPFKVALIGDNGEKLMSSELLTTRRNCTKNLLAVINIIDASMASRSILVHDFTDKKFKPCRIYLLYWDGLEEDVN